jgi:magnesium transporter
MEVPVAGPDDRAGDVRLALMGRTYDSLADVAVCKGHELLGLVTIERLVGADAQVPLRDLLDDAPPIVGPAVDEEEAAWRMVRHDETSIAVVAEDGRFLGLIPPQRMLAVLVEEHEEDLSRLAGVLHQANAARTASEEPVSRRLWHRLPWLLIGSLGAFATALLVASFEQEIAENVEIAFFLPAVVYLADAVGTQTETVLIRGLSIGVTVRSIVRREALTGLLIGVVIAACFVPVGLLLVDGFDLAVGVAIALLVSCSIATTVAIVLPYALSRAGADPAFGSGPLATVVQDVLSIVVYFVVMVQLVG